MLDHARGREAVGPSGEPPKLASLNPVPSRGFLIRYSENVLETYGPETVQRDAGAKEGFRKQAAKAKGREGEGMRRGSLGFTVPLGLPRNLWPHPYFRRKASSS